MPCHLFYPRTSEQRTQILIFILVCWTGVEKKILYPSSETYAKFPLSPLSP